MFLQWYLSMKIKFRKIRTIFDIEITLEVKMTEFHWNSSNWNFFSFFNFSIFFLLLKVLKVWRLGKKMSSFQTVRILKMFRTSRPNVMSGTALLQSLWKSARECGHANVWQLPCAILNLTKCIFSAFLGKFVLKLFCYGNKILI